MRKSLVLVLVMLAGISMSMPLVAQAKSPPLRKQVKILRKENQSLRKQKVQLQSNLAQARKEIEEQRKRLRVLEEQKQQTTQTTSQTFAEQLVGLSRLEIFHRYLVPLNDAWGCPDSITDSVGELYVYFEDPCEEILTLEDESPL